MSYFTNFQKTNKVRVIGIDPGLRHTGWAVVDIRFGQIIYIASGVIDTDSKDPIAVRLTQIHNKLSEVIDSYQPNSAGLEETYVNKNYASSLKLAHARGVSMVTASMRGLEVIEYAPKTVKKTIVGNGSAPKDQLSRMLAILVPGVVIKSEDESDALAIAICHGLHF
jgi:crossover junction endodeoxyribonuclease RuvC